jgi:hypothetical protein
LARLPPNAVASSLKRDDAMSLIIEIVAVQSRLASARRPGRLIDEADAPSA